MKVNFMRHLALLHVVSRFPLLRAGATLSILAMSVPTNSIVSRFQSPRSNSNV